MTQSTEVACPICHTSSLVPRETPRFGGEARLLGRVLNGVGYFSLFFWLASVLAFVTQAIELGPHGLGVVLLFFGFGCALAILLALTAYGSVLAHSRTQSLVCGHCGAAFPARAGR